MNPEIDSDGNKRWFNKNGEYHRENGPAIVEWANGDKWWWINGKEITEDFHSKLTQGPIKDLPLYLGLRCDKYISERLSG